MNAIPENATYSPDGNYWWDGAQWQPVSAASVSTVPANTTYSPDGNYWWDGSQWQLVSANTGAQAASTGASAAGTGASAASVRMQSITLWFNVFIPDQKVSALGECFHGDDRSFDSSAGASSRVHAAVTVSGLGTSGAAMGSTDVHCGVTRLIDCATGAETQSATATPSGGFANFHVGNTVPDPEGGVHDTANEMTAVLSLDVTASDPLVAAAPTVGADLLITIDPIAGTVAVAGLIDHWPAFEGYAAPDGGAPVTLFQISPPLGSDPFTLLQPRNVPVDVSVKVA